ncbi:uncharacterized protein LOC111344257 isoform X1 [Stylophora pistillata]|nr:uncharacterized protein LOC111344257 isoform X1 [Stylophora pistillata]XP_022807202.1 uncharacterized protein LOC111344257 isoform X1 [Stylophora pistillata]XP_022807203.1 uncharacterized protein LOC111344257 isoform X1 [Stylophora pistillata]XP_022807204.1 uncharacterized protein LOC111344257 isoform X1 [Stylophora pistillata]
MLNFYHDLGMIVKHGSTVVLKAQWLIDLFKRLITIPRYEDLGRDCKNVTEWKILEETGILHMELVRLVFSDFIKEDSVTEKDILDLMEQFGLIAKFATSTDFKYFVPAQLKTSPKHLYEMKPEPFHPCPLYIDFLNGFVPHGIYYQLVSRCIRWCSEYGCQEQPSLFNGGASFFISKQDVYQLILLCQKRFIKIVLTHRKPSKQEYLTEQSQVASDLLSFLNSALEGLSKQIPWQGNLRYELRVACPFCPLRKIKCHDHGYVSCPHENCFCLLKMAPEEKLICPRSICNEIPSVSGLGKWFPWEHLKAHQKKREFSGESVSPQKGGNAKRLRDHELTSSVKQGTPTGEELEKIGSEIAEKWMILGRRLGVNDSKLKDIEQADTSLCERAYQMLLHWKQKESSDATYQVLSCALRHKLVQRTDLAEKFYQTDVTSSERRVENGGHICQGER